jgi:response regulator RpfG family c-di-GMP phosphodiesterase
VNTVLVIDDSKTNLDVYARVLKQAGDVEIRSFLSSSDAFAWTQSNVPDLVVVDYRMPEMNGLEFIRAFRAKPGNADVPVVMVTASHDKEVRYEALKLGADDFVEKPADPVEFLARARNMIKLRERSKKLAESASWLKQEVRKKTAEIARREQETILRLTRATEHRDRETKNHIARMGHYASLLAKAVGLSDERQELLLLAAPMHDIGKVAVPDRILLKEGRLTPEEWEIMKGHARAGYDILKDSDSPLIQLAAEIALTHHEKWDGSGYPQRLIGDAIPLSGRICAVGDVFDALLSVRPYKPAWSLPQVIEQLRRDRGTHFDPVLIDAFLDIMPWVQEVRREFSDEEAA